MIKSIFLIIFMTLPSYSFEFLEAIQVKGPIKKNQVVGTVPNLSGEMVSVIFPYTKFIHQSGRVEYANSKGVFNLKAPRSEYKISLSSKYFSMQYDSVELDASLPTSEIIQMEHLFREDFLSARANLETGRLAVLKHMPILSDKSWFYSQVPVELNGEEGCSAAWDGRRILVYQGDANCSPPAFSADLLLHEYGHGIFENINTRGILPTDISEGLADLFMAMVTRDPIFAEGFNTGKPITYIRSMEFDYKWPDDWRGAYTGSLILSSVFWDLVQVTKKVQGPQVYNSGLKALLAYGSRITRSDELSVPSVSNALSSVFIREVAPPHYLYCAYNNILNSRGIIESTENCFLEQELLPASYQSRAGMAGQYISLVTGEIPNDGKLVTHFEVRRPGITSIEVNTSIEHNFANDLYFYFLLEDGRKISIYRGLEEILIPEKIFMNNFPRDYSGAVQFVIEDIGVDYGGQLFQGEVRLFYN